MKKEFRLEDYTKDKGKFAMSFNHRNELIEFCFYLHSKGRKWINENTYTDIGELDFVYHRYENFILYFNEGVYGESTDIIKNNYTILEYSDFDYDYQSKDKMKELEDRVAELEKQVKELKGENIEDKGLLNGKFICVKEFSSYTTKGKIYEFIDGFSKYDNGKCFPQARGGFDSLDDLNNTIGVFEPYVEEEELLNGKFVCVEEYDGCTTKGKVYEFINGVSKYDDGDRMPLVTSPFKNLEDLNKRVMSKFEPFVEDKVEKEDLLNGKFVCTHGDGIFITEGKVYKFTNGVSNYDNREIFPQSRDAFKNLDDLNTTCHKFKKYEDESSDKEELLNGKFICTKGYDGCTTKGKMYEFIDGCSQYDDGDKMSNNGSFPFKNLEDLNKKMVSKFAPYREELLNGKFVCVETSSIFLTVGKIYEFINGFSKYDDGDKMPWSNPTKNLEDLNSRTISKFIPLVEDKVGEEDLSDGAFVYTKDSHNFLTKKKLCEWMDS